MTPTPTITLEIEGKRVDLLRADLPKLGEEMEIKRVFTEPDGRDVFWRNGHFKNIDLRWRWLELESDVPILERHFPAVVKESYPGGEVREFTGNLYPQWYESVHGEVRGVLVVSSGAVHLPARPVTADDVRRIVREEIEKSNDRKLCALYCEIIGDLKKEITFWKQSYSERRKERDAAREELAAERAKAGGGQPIVYTREYVEGQDKSIRELRTQLQEAIDEAYQQEMGRAEAIKDLNQARHDRDGWQKEALELRRLRDRLAKELEAAMPRRT